MHTDETETNSQTLKDRWPKTDSERISELVALVIGLTDQIEALTAEQTVIRALLAEYKDAVIPAVEKLQDSPVFKMIAGK